MTDGLLTEKSCEMDETTGNVTLRWAGRDEQGTPKLYEFTLRPPMLGEKRQLEELIEAAETAGEKRRKTAETKARRDAEKAGVAFDPATVVVPAPTVAENHAANLGWWRKAFDLCCTEPLPPSDYCAPFLAEAPTLIWEVRSHWSLHPTKALGSLLNQLLGASSNGNG